MEGRSAGHPVGCSDVLMGLCSNLGCEIDAVIAWPEEPGRAEKEKLAWEKVRAAVDSQCPCYGHALGLPGYQVISGYDGRGYIVGNAGETVQPWDGLNGFEIHVARKTQPADDRTAVRAGVRFALQHSRSPREWTEADQFGLSAYDSWIEALRPSKATDLPPDADVEGISAAYSLYRSLAVEFLKEARTPLGGKCTRILDSAVQHYDTVRVNLQDVAAHFPLGSMANHPDLLNDKAVVSHTVDCLRAARSAEAEGLKTLQELVDVLRSRGEIAQHRPAAGQYSPRPEGDRSRRCAVRTWRSSPSLQWVLSPRPLRGANDRRSGPSRAPGVPHRG